MFAYSPRSCNEGFCFNTCGTNKTRASQQGLLKGVKVVKVTDIQESIRYIGGVKVLSYNMLFMELTCVKSLFPFFAHLSETEASGIESTMTAQLLGLLTGMLQGHKINQVNAVPVERTHTIC
jgi:hypothetical protein